MVSKFLMAASCAAFLGTAASATEPCFEVIEAMNFALQGLPEENVTGVSLKDQGETRYMLFIALEPKQNEGPNNTNASWRLLERQKESLTYCLAGAGRSMEVLESLHDIPGFNVEFGLPGSLKRRCNDEADGPMGSVAVRAWASKELGPSLVQFFGEAFRGDVFTVLLAEEGSGGRFPWIILQKKGNRNCYYARGDESDFHLNFKLRGELRQDPATLAPLE